MTRTSFIAWTQQYTSQLHTIAVLTEALVQDAAAFRTDTDTTSASPAEAQLLGLQHELESILRAIRDLAAKIDHLRTEADTF